MSEPVLSEPEFVLDTVRAERVGFGEAVYCASKTVSQIAAILRAGASPMLLTRLDAAAHDALPASLRATLDYDPASRTAFSGPPRPLEAASRIAIVTAGTSDLAVAAEAARTLRFNGHDVPVIADVGVAGLWRLMRRLEELRRMRVLIVAAGMDAALPSVIGGLVASVVIAVPTSVGYGVATGGQTALNAILASCAPGIVTVNIDNGYGAACAALRMIGTP